MPRQRHRSVTSGSPKLTSNRSIIFSALGVLSLRFLSSAKLDNLLVNKERQPGSAKAQIEISFRSSFSSFAILFLSSFGSAVELGACLTMCCTASLARSSQYASQIAVIRTMADLFRTSKRKRLPCLSPPKSEWISSNRPTSAAFASKLTRALLGTRPLWRSLQGREYNSAPWL